MWDAQDLRLAYDMTHKELLDKVAKFVHGVNSRGTVLMPWKHEEGCGMCDGILEIIKKVLEDYNEAVGVVYPKKVSLTKETHYNVKVEQWKHIY